ncbi:MAG: hypothetical protein V8S95_01755 [Odoribacter sp.]
MTTAWRNVPIAFMQYLKKGADFITPDGEIIANARLTVAPPPSRSYAYMTDTLFRERFAGYVQGVDLLYHEATYSKEDQKLAKDSFHSTAEQAAELPNSLKSGNCYWAIFPARYPDPVCLLPEARATFPETYICHDGEVYDVPAIKRNI